MAPGPFDEDSVAASYRRYLVPYLFAPWSERLLAFVGLRTGQSVLDVASGTGVVARAAASIVGPTGRVVASDISPRMLQQVRVDLDRDGAPIDTLECAATDIPLADESVDVVLCQQGFPFMPDRAAVAREVHRVLRPGGAFGVAVWAVGEQLVPLDTYGQVVRDEGLESAFGRSASNDKLNMTEDDVRDALLAGGFDDVTVATERLDVRWPSLTEEAMGILGTPYGSVVTTLDPDRRDRFFQALRDALAGPDGGPVTHTTGVVIARAAKAQR
jgi:ubiquinone/menaquinone biosynthesis C-methylase UbiE